MGIKAFFIKQLLKSKLKNVPESQRDMLLGMIDKNPDLFKKIGDEVQRRMKQGQSELAATMVVMREHQSELQKML